jgi:hypothetical protein
VDGLSRGSRIVLSAFSGVFGVVMVATAPPTDQAPAFYVIALFCLLICIACIGKLRVRQFLGSSVGSVLFAASLWYGCEHFGQPAFFNALVFFVGFGLPGLAYAASTRFGFWRKHVDVLAGADYPNRLQRPIPFYNRDPWNLIFGFAGAIAVAVCIALAATPWMLLVPLLVWAVVSNRRHFRRKWALRDKGYFSHRQGQDHWIYEERQGYSLVAFILPVANTEPGHWELFIPDDAKWRATVPVWALDRRKEIALRIAEEWKPKDFHLPSDFGSV